MHCFSWWGLLGLRRRAVCWICRRWTALSGALPRSVGRFSRADVCAVSCESCRWGSRQLRPQPASAFNQPPGAAHSAPSLHAGGEGARCRNRAVKRLKWFARTAFALGPETRGREPAMWEHGVQRPPHTRREGRRQRDRSAECRIHGFFSENGEVLHDCKKRRNRPWARAGCVCKQSRVCVGGCLRGESAG